MRERVAGGAEPDHEHVVAAIVERDRTAAVERVPAREQAVDLEAPGQREHVGEHAGLDLRNVDRLLLLEDAGLHAVVADAVAGAGQHRVVAGDERERRHRVAATTREVHLGDALVERAARERDAERVRLERAGLVAQPARAGVLLAIVAVEAVIDLPQDLPRRHATVGEAEAVARAQLAERRVDLFGELRLRATNVHQVQRIGRGHRLTQAEPAALQLGGAGHDPKLERGELGAHFDERGVLGGALLELGLAIDEPHDDLRDRFFVILLSQRQPEPREDRVAGVACSREDGRSCASPRGASRTRL